MSVPLRVLIVEDRPSDVELLLYTLQRTGYDVKRWVVDNEADYLVQLENHPDIILSDYSLPQFSALRALALLQSRGLDIPFIIVTGTISEEVAVESIKLGASDYLIKDRLARLGQAISYALHEKKLRDEKRTAEERLHLLSLAVAQSTEGVAILDLNGLVLFCNPALSRIYGYDHNGLLGKDFAQVYGAIRKPEAESIAAEVLEKGFFKGETWHMRKDGDLFSVYLNQSLVRDHAGSAMGFLVTVRDHTEQKKVEVALEVERATLARRVEERTVELMVANAELGRASRLKDEFLASMSHELRTPLNAILGLSEALIEETYGPLNSRQANSLNRIHESGRHLLALITDILDISKIEAGKITLEISPIAVTDVCEASLRMVKQAALAKGISTALNLAGSSLVLNADQRRLKQILVNLLSNAIKFTPKGGEVGLDVYRDDETGEMCFEVWDTGIGIHPFDLERIFEPFVQLDSSLSRMHPGTGLGLALVRRLALLHGGRVAVESELDKGSRFTLRLPLRQGVPFALRDADPGLDAPVRIAHPSTVERKGTIMFVEDHEDTLVAISEYLSGKGYTVSAVTDGHNLLEHIGPTSPDLLLMDIQLPDISGLDLIARLRREPAWSKLPIIAVTALVMPGDRERCLAAGANEYLAKPVRLARLLEIIEGYLPPTNAGLTGVGA